MSSRQEGREEQDVLGKTTPPLQERITLPSLKLDRRHLPCPRRPTRHLEALDVLPLPLVKLLLLLRGEEVGVMGSGVEVRVRDDLDVLAFCATR